MMIKEEILFVTKATNEWDERFSYVVEFTQTLKAGIAVLMVISKGPQNTYDEMMVAVALAEGGVPELAREHLLSEQERRIKDVEAKNVRELTNRCKELAIDFTCEVRVGDTISLVGELLKKRHTISLVLLSPNLSRVLDTRKMIKNITKPIVLITRQGKEG
jgi:DNA-binding transcriptional regulator YbjK